MSSMERAQPLILNRYQPVEKAGSGGFGTVTVAWDTRIQRKVAIKTIELSEMEARRAALPGADAVNVNPSSTIQNDELDFVPIDSQDTATEELFIHSLTYLPGLDEARTAAMLSDPSIVAVYDFEIQGTTAYLIMEYVEGMTLTRLLREYDSEITLDIITAVFSAVVHALEVAHENQVLHLDIKPDNVLIDRQGRVKVTDFGLATLADASGFGTTGGGTIGYMPLEQMRQENLDVRCDEWALASMMYELLSGENPFFAPNLSRAEEVIENAELVLPSLCWDGLDAGIDDVIFNALDPDRDERYDSISDFANALEPYLGNAKQGVRELTAIVGNAQLDDEDEFVAEDSVEKTRIPLRNRITQRVRNVVAHVVGALGCALVAFVALSNIPWSSIPFIGGWEFLLFWVLFALIVLAGAIRPHLGALLSYGALSAALFTHEAIALGCVFLAVTIVWWYFVARQGDNAANVGFVSVLAGGVWCGQLAPLAAGFCLRPVRAIGAAIFSAFVGGIFATFGSMTLLGWNPQAFWNFVTLVDITDTLLVLLTRPEFWCFVVSWIVSAWVLAFCRMRSTRRFAVLGTILGGIVLFVGVCAAAWFASGQLSWVPSVFTAVTTLIPIVAVLICCALVADEPYEYQN